MEIIKSLTDMSEELDSAKLNKIADKVDIIAKNIVMIKTAQFVGIQGFAIRNSRCWGNCYRQKRTKNKNMPAQKVWEECHKEYLASINNDNSGWEKYAKGSNGLTKFSTKINEENKHFAYLLNNNIKKGIPIGQSFVLSTEDTIEKYSKQIISEAECLIKIACELKKENNIELSNKLINISKEVIKEAQFGGWWDKLKGGVKNSLFGKKKVWLKNLEDIANKVYEDGNVYRQNPRDPNAIRQYNQSALRLQRAIGSNFNKMNEMFANDPGFTPISSAMKNFATLKPGDSRVRQLNELLGTIRQYQSKQIPISSPPPVAGPPQPMASPPSPATSPVPQTDENALTTEEEGRLGQEVPGAATAGPTGLPQGNTQYTPEQKEMIKSNKKAVFEAIMNWGTAKSILLEQLRQLGYVPSATTASNKNKIKKAAVEAQRMLPIMEQNPQEFVKEFLSGVNIEKLVEYLNTQSGYRLALSPEAKAKKDKQREIDTETVNIVAPENLATQVEEAKKIVNTLTLEESQKLGPELLALLNKANEIRKPQGEYYSGPSTGQNVPGQGEITGLQGRVAKVKNYFQIK